MNPARDHKELSTLSHGVLDLQRLTSAFIKDIIKAQDPNSECGIHGSPREVTKIMNDGEWLIECIILHMNKFKGVKRSRTISALADALEQNKLLDLNAEIDFDKEHGK